MKIKHRLLLTHGLLIILTLVIVLINTLAYNNMRADAETVNDLGKLRATSFNMAHKAVLIEHSQSSEEKNELKIFLASLVDLFDDRLDSLYSTKTLKHEETLVELDEIKDFWEKTYKPINLRIIDESASEEDFTVIVNNINEFVQDINDMVHLYSIYAKKKVINALSVNGGLITAIIFISIYSFTTTNRWVNKPITDLSSELKKLALYGKNPLDADKLTSDEISEMGKYFNIMIFDQLTKTYSRRPGLSKLDDLVSNISGNTLLSLCFVDIDGLKSVNDTLGHEKGDQFIIDIVSCIKEAIRQSDFIIRMGGDEFLIVFYGIGEEESERVWLRIQDCFIANNNSDKNPYILDASHGIVSFTSGDDINLEELIKIADKRMYEEKSLKKERKL